MRKKTLALILILIMMATLFSGCHRPGEEAATTNLSLDEQVRIAANNMLNDCDFATDGKYLYCSGWDDGSNSFPYLAKVRLDDFSVESTYETKISSGNEFLPYNITCIDNTLYFYNWNFNIPFTLNTEMTEEMQLPFSYFVTDGEYYYVSDTTFFFEPGIYRVSKDEITEETKNKKEIYTKISDLYATKLILQGQYLYVASGNLNWNGEDVCQDGMWRMDLDGGNPIQILNASPRYFLVSENQLYVVEEEDCIYSMNLDGTERKVLREAYIDADMGVTSINIADNYIFYRYAENGTLHRVNTDGTNDIQLNDCDSTNIVIAGDWVIYLNGDDWNYYKMHFDGSNHSLISEVPTDEDPTEATETSEMLIETEPVAQTQGSYTLEEAQEMEGLFILYPDGSFDRYNGGYVLTWNTQPMTYGSDSFPEDLIISTNRIDRNKSALNGGQLVIFWPYENRVRDGLYAVEESGYSLFRTDDEGDLEGLILTRGSTTGTGLVQWNQSHTFYWSNSINYTTINGVPKEQYDGFPSTEGRDFGSFPAHQTFTIGVVEGTTLIEKEYETDHMYFLHADSSSPYTLTPTTESYAIFDFSDTPSGEYVYTVSRWDPDRRARRVVSTYIVLE